MKIRKASLFAHDINSRGFDIYFSTVKTYAFVISYFIRKMKLSGLATRIEYHFPERKSRNK